VVPGGPDGQQIPEIDEIVRKGQEQLRVLMGGRGGRSGGGGGGGDGFKFTRGTFGIGALLVIGLWAFNSFYTVRPEEQSVELFLGEFSSIGNPGLNFAPWPLVTAEVLAVTRENSISIGTNRPARRRTV
jgi:membrane protease subunit HflK